MSQLPTPTTPTHKLVFSLPLDEYVEEIVRWREFATIGKIRAAQLKFVDPGEEVLHIEPGENPDIFLLYKIKDWKASYAKFLLIKAQAERNRQKAFLVKDLREKFFAAIIRKTGLTDRESLAKFWDSVKDKRNILVGMGELTDAEVDQIFEA